MDSKVSRGAPPQRPWKKIAKYGTEQLCAPLSSIILQSFNLIGHVIGKEIEIEHFKRRAPTAKKNIRF